MSRIWKKIPLSEAQTHPLYGIKNWLAVFAFGVLLGGLRELGSLNGEAHKAGLTITELLAIDHPAISFAKLSLWINVGIVSVIYWALLTKNLKFRLIASSLLLASWPMGALLGVAYPFEGLGEALGLSLFPWAISCGVWVTYLNRSKRVRVTFENEVLVESSEDLIIQASQPSAKSARFEHQNTHVSASLRQQVSQMPTVAPRSNQNSTTADASPRADLEETMWATALQEVEGSARKQGLWAKSFAECNGDEAAAKAAYLRERVSRLKEEALAATSAAAAIQSKARAEAQIQIDNLKSDFISGRTLSPKDYSLLANFADQDSKIVQLWERFQGETILHRCARLGLQSEVESLLKNGANPNASNGNGQKPFAVADDFELRRILIAAASGEA